MPKVMRVLPWIGSTQALYDHEMVRFVPQVLDGHVLEDPAFGSQDVVCPGPYYPPLSHHLPYPPILAPRLPSQKEVPHKIFQACCLHRRRGLLIPSPTTRILEVHV